MSITRRIRRLGRFDALVLTASIWFLAKFVRYVFPLLFESFQETYVVSNTVLGAAFTGFMIVYAMMQFPSGLLADRLGSVVVITAGATLTALAAFLVVLEPPFVLLVGAMMLMGAGTGAHKTVAIRLLSRAYPTRTGRALGVLDTVGTFGGVAAPAAVVVVAVVPLLFEPGWRTLFFAAGLVGLALAAGFVVRVPKRLPDESAGITTSGEALELRQYVAMFRAPRFTAFVVVTILFSFTYNGFVAFVYLYLREAGLGQPAASTLFSVLFALSLVQLVSGEISDRVGTLPVIVVALGLASVGLAAFVALTGTGSAVVLGGTIVVLGLGAHGFRPVRGAYLMSVIPPSIAGGSLGIVRTLLMGSGAIAPVTVGFLSETIGFRPAFWLLAASVAVAAVVSGILLVTEPANVERRSNPEPESAADESKRSGTDHGDGANRP